MDKSPLVKVIIQTKNGLYNSETACVATLVKLIQYKHDWPSVTWNGSVSKWQTVQLTVLWFSDLTQTVQSNVKWLKLSPNG